ncbi:hypothetical protein JCM10212_005478 [Sporobolomyces blumeae]
MQFEDAPDDDSLQPSPAPSLTAPTVPPSTRHEERTVPGPFLDDDDADKEHDSLARADPSVIRTEGPEEWDEDEDDEYYFDDDDEEEEQDYGLEEGLREVMDQDWADASGDFTKRYNRMKQQVVATRSASSPLAHPPTPSSSALDPSSTSNGTRSALEPSSTLSAAAARQPSPAVLPALNRARRRPPPPPTLSRSSDLERNTAANSKSETRSGAPGGGGGGGGGSNVRPHGNKVSDQLSQLSTRFAHRLSLEPLHSSGTATRKGGSEKVSIKDKSDRATNEQVLDPRTRLILFKMLGRGLIERVDGCVSTGKEANVYHAIGPWPEEVEGAKANGLGHGQAKGKTRGQAEEEDEVEVEPEREGGVGGGKEGEGQGPRGTRHLALKIYKTSILVFKDRDRYVTGEYRFKNGYARSNPRKMVRLWAEKELRNLRRMRTAGLRVPEAIEVRENVLVMDFLRLDEGGDGDEWQASPRLKDAKIDPSRLPSLYVEILQILRVMFYRCRLVHADFSEYNILFHADHLWIIDVSQSIEHEHPAAFDFLRNDIKNAEEWFARRGVRTLGLRKTFGFVTGDTWVKGRDETDEDVKEEVERLLRKLEEEDQEIDEDDDDEEDPTVAGEGERETIDGLATKTSEELFTSLSSVTASSSTNPPPGPTTQQKTTKKKQKKADTSEQDDAVFAQSYIPRALDDVYDPERDVQRVLRGEGSDLIYADITGVARIHKDEAERGRKAEGETEGRGGEQEVEDEESEQGELGEEPSEDDTDEEGGEEKRPRGKKHEDKDEKKKRRQEVKEKNREKRATKMSKAEKAKRVKKTSGKR